MSQIATLRPSERVEIDPEQVFRLRRCLGARECDAALSAAMEELAYWLYHFERARKTGETGALAGAAGRIVGLARMTGLVSVARAAQAAEALCGGGTASAASAAVAARLTRVGERSILEVWELQDMTL